MVKIEKDWNGLRSTETLKNEAKCLEDARLASLKWWFKDLHKKGLAKDNQSDSSTQFGLKKKSETNLAFPIRAVGLHQC